jgi:uncharacterized protein (TIGR00730 family)
MPLSPPAAKPQRAICVYCGSSSGSNPAYTAAARKLGTDMAAAGFGLVYGGGGIGLMGEVARSVLAAGGHVLGVIPGFLKQREVHFKDASELIVTKDMHARKMLMFERADAFVALPGGIGTLEELIEQMTWAQLGRHGKPVIVADIAGFWGPLLTLLDHMSEQAFLHKPFMERAGQAIYDVVADAGEIVPRIQSLLAAMPPGSAPGQIAGRF